MSLHDRVEKVWLDDIGEAGVRKYVQLLRVRRAAGSAMLLLLLGGVPIAFLPGASAQVTLNILLGIVLVLIVMIPVFDRRVRLEALTFQNVDRSNLRYLDVRYVDRFREIVQDMKAAEGSSADARGVPDPSDPSGIADLDSESRQQLPGRPLIARQAPGLDVITRRVLSSLLILFGGALIVLSVFEFAVWHHPAQGFAHSALALASLAGAWRLWKTPKPRPQPVLADR